MDDEEVEKQSLRLSAVLLYVACGVVGTLCGWLFATVVR